MYLIGLGTSVPRNRYTQAQCWSAMQRSPQFSQLNSRSHAVLRKVLGGENGIATRHLAIEELDHAFVLTPRCVARPICRARACARDASRRTRLHNARLTPADVDAILVSTCTGYMCPGLTSHVSERLGLRAGVLALDLVGQGCGAALPNCCTAEALILHAGGREVLSALQKCLHLDATDTLRSALVLRENGNLSSPFVFFVLERALADNAPGGCWWMSSFGAGFGCHGAILKVD